MVKKDKKRAFQILSTKYGKNCRIGKRSFYLKVAKEF